MASLRTGPQSSARYPGTQNSGKFGGRTGFNCQIQPAKCQESCLNLCTDLRQINQIRMDSEQILISPNLCQPKISISLCTCNVPHARLLYACILIVFMYIFLNKSEAFQKQGLIPTGTNTCCPTAAREAMRDVVRAAPLLPSAAVRKQHLTNSGHMTFCNCLCHSDDKKMKADNIMFAVEKMPPPPLQLLFIFHYETN